mgnify:CR=1 FL=1
MSRRVDFETILKDKFFLFQGEKNATLQWLQQPNSDKIYRKVGRADCENDFSNTSLIQQKVRQAYGRNSICLPHFFIDSFILLLFCTVRFLRICILLFGCIRIVCCAGCFRCAVIGLFYALTWHIC